MQKYKKIINFSNFRVIKFIKFIKLQVLLKIFIFHFSFFIF